MPLRGFAGVRRVHARAGDAGRRPRGGDRTCGRRATARPRHEAADVFPPLLRDVAALAVAERERLRETFGEDAALYDRMRPGYPAALFEDLASAAGLARGARVL